MSSKLILYGTIASPPVRAVLLTLHALELEFEFENVDVRAGGTRSEEFQKKNPQHTVPVLDDNGAYIWDSHAIAAYLVRKYGKTDTLYPKDYYRRAVVDQRLHFDSGILFGRGMKGFTASNVSREEKVEAVFEAYNFLEAFLGDNTYLAGDQLTIADFSILSNITTLNAIVPIDATKTLKLFAWFNLMRQLPYYEEANGKGEKIVIEIVKTLTAEGRI